MNAVSVVCECDVELLKIAPPFTRMDEENLVSRGLHFHALEQGKIVSREIRVRKSIPSLRMDSEDNKYYVLVTEIVLEFKK